MKLFETAYDITKKHNSKCFITNINGTYTEATDPAQIKMLASIYRLLVTKKYPDTYKRNTISRILFSNGYPDIANQILSLQKVQVTQPTETKVSNDPVIDTETRKNAIENLINFFSEFDFEPNFRFVNTFARMTNIKRTRAKEYVANYFALIDSPYQTAISEKMKSLEFTQLCDIFATIKVENQINKRFKLYYGSQGTGKTTKAIEEAEGNCMVCHSAMLPSDLMEDFKFVDGKATFTQSALQKAMIEGKKIVLDEINLLPFESLRFLQSILDGKKQFEYKGITIEIKEGFQIIGTMNLQVNGSIYSLPEPLVDRCEDIRCYKLTAENLLGALL